MSENKRAEINRTETNKTESNSDEINGNIPNIYETHWAKTSNVSSNKPLIIIVV